MDDHTRDPSVGPPRSGSPTGWLPAEDRWEHDSLRRATGHGVRLYNAGAYHEAHDCFEDAWYDFGQGSVESRFCHGMVQVAAGAHKRFDFEDDGGMRSLFETARVYLRDVPADFYGVDVRAVRATLAAALEDPAAIDGRRLSLDGERPVAGPADRAYADGLD